MSNDVTIEFDPGAHAFEARIGGQLVAAAFDAAREANEPVVPICPYVQHWLGEHPDERDLVDEELTAQLTDD